jgi:hypothetical protein
MTLKHLAWDFGNIHRPATYLALRLDFAVPSPAPSLLL